MWRASIGWVNNFMSRNGFSLHHKTIPAQQDPERLIDKHILYVLYARRFSIKYKYPLSSVMAMDEISVSNDMVSNATIHKQGTKSVCLRTTGHEKYMVSACFAAKVDGTKLKPVVVFHAVKRESKSLDKEFESCCVVKSPGNTWINEELITIWVKRVLGAFSFNRRLLARDSYECHMTNSLRKDLKEVSANGCIKNIQRI